jgi:hypothetical protein
MPLIPLPQEAVEITLLSTKRQILQQLKSKIKIRDSLRGKKIIERSCMNLADFILSGESYSYEKIDTLIDDMHRTTIYLQKRKQNLQRKKNK